MSKTSITVTTEIDLDVKTAAAWFAGLDDEQQAQFFIDVAEAAKAWDGAQSSQWFFVGRHLRDCECSTYEARDLIESIAGGIQQKAEAA